MCPFPPPEFTLPPPPRVSSHEEHSPSTLGSDSWSSRLPPLFSPIWQDFKTVFFFLRAKSFPFFPRPSLPLPLGNQDFVFRLYLRSQLVDPSRGWIRGGPSSPAPWKSLKSSFWLSLPFEVLRDLLFLRAFLYRSQILYPPTLSRISGDESTDFGLCSFPDAGFFFSQIFFTQRCFFSA